MTYLNGPRLHFAGQFRADVSTVNNAAANFRDSNTPVSPSWNPGGSGRWTLAGCTVTRAVYQDGSVAETAAQDSAVGLALGQTGSAVLVDLDTEQQLVSQIWGMGLTLGKPGAPPAFRGAFHTAAFSDLWDGRVGAGLGDIGLTAFYHSVLTGVAWSQGGDSRLLTELDQSSATALLSIKFNVDGFNFSAHRGRIVGTIGVASADEPAHFVAGRHCMPVSADSPVGYFPALVDATRAKLLVDFGNALPTTSVGGPMDSSQDFEIGVLSGSTFHPLGRVPIGGGQWYEQTAAVCEFPSDRALTTAELDLLTTNPVAVRHTTGDTSTIVAHEGLDGKHVRADDFVYRLGADATEDVTLWATKFGERLPNAPIDLRAAPELLAGGPIAVGTPAGGIDFPDRVVTGAEGTAVATLHAGSIDRPRNFIDGQVYGIGYALAGSDPTHGAYTNEYDFVSALVWSDYHAPAEPSWIHDVEPILGQYARLYPVMKPIVDLADYDSVVGNKDILEEVFNLAQDDPHYMPVTRDLSPAKRQMILAWLKTTGNAGQPTLDRDPGEGATALAVSEHVGSPAPLGDKTAALARLRAR